MRDIIVAARVQDRGQAEVSVIILTADLKQERTKWLAECLELGTATYGETLDEARNDLLEAVTLQLNEVQQMGFIEDYLVDHGVPVIPIITTRIGRGSRPGSSWRVPALAGTQL